MVSNNHTNQINLKPNLIQKKLGKAFLSALNEPDIKEGVSRSGRRVEYFEKEIRERKDEIERAVAKEMEALEYAKDNFEKASSELSALEKQKPQSPSECNKTFLFVVYVIIFWGLLILLLYGKLGRGAWLAGFRDMFQSIYLFFLGAFVLLISGVWIFFLRRARKNYPGWTTEYESTKKIFTEKENLHSENERNFEDVLTRSGVMPILRNLVEDAGKPNFSTKLGEIDAPGLAEVYDRHYKVDTQAMDQLNKRLESMPGGSIGIAGPRGSGKTTLMSSFCDAGSWKLGQRSVLSVMIPAPIDYEVRDFVLHLFSCVCRRLLEINHIPEREWSPTAQPDNSSTILSKILLPLLPFRRILYMVGVTLLLCYLLLGFIEFKILLAHPQETQSIPRSTQIESTEPDVNNVQDVATNNSTESINTTPKGSGSSGEIETSPNIFEELSHFAKALGLKPMTFLQLGLLLLLTGLALNYIVRNTRAGEREKTPATVHSREDMDDELVQHALDYLDQIKFQESFTSGWSGALKLPLGVNAGFTGSVTRSSKPLSLPEIVTHYHKFIVELTKKHFTVIIGIDEIDKMESDDKAQRFLNDIKMIFGVEHCFYLISVSESAMSSFERRGIPFRNVFDSSFDEIIYVKYLDFEQSLDLIKKRVIGMPIPCIALCYCLSGGLARDLIRTCRYALDEPIKAKVELTIGQLCEHMVKSDIMTKLRALEINAKDLGLDHETTNFLTEIHEIEAECTDTKAILTRAKGLLSNVPELATGVDQSDSYQKSRQILVRLQEELAIYLFYCATLRQFFTNRFGKNTLERVQTSGSLDLLAKARQSFAVNHGVTRLILENLRRKRRIRPISLKSQKAR